MLYGTRFHFLSAKTMYINNFFLETTYMIKYLFFFSLHISRWDILLKKVGRESSFDWGTIRLEPCKCPTLVDIMLEKTHHLMFLWNHNHFLSIHYFSFSIFWKIIIFLISCDELMVKGIHRSRYNLSLSYTNHVYYSGFTLLL